MAQWIQMNPVTRDYVFQNGSPVPSNRIQEASYFALLVPRNNWLFGAASQGSLLYTLENLLRSASIEQLYASYAEDAIQTQVIATGLATQVSVTNQQATRTGTANNIRVVAAAVPVQSQFSFVGV